MSYYEMLKHPKWQKRRLEVLERAGFVCSDPLCGNSEETLHVHHTRYRKGAKPWEYSDDELRVLCESCHKETESARDELLLYAGKLEVWDILELSGVAKAMLYLRSMMSERLGGIEETCGACCFFGGILQVRPFGPSGAAAFLCKSKNAGHVVTTELLYQAMRNRQHDLDAKVVLQS